jgi:hypothetical protein
MWIRYLTFENNCLQGKLTVGDPFEDSGVEVGRAADGVLHVSAGGHAFAVGGHVSAGGGRVEGSLSPVLLSCE